MSRFNIDSENKHLGISGGYMGISPTWEEYIKSVPEEIAPVLEAFLVFIQKSSYFGGVAQDISEHRKVGLYWKFYIGNDVKWSISFSWRGWGDFMAAAENICEEMGYMNYYC